jgi:hypothetical protein
MSVRKKRKKFTLNELGECGLTDAYIFSFCIDGSLVVFASITYQKVGILAISVQ